ncbi:metal-activated pyridoxal enzyme [Piscirickettsia salmonis]|uniref:D-threonine aldolase n=1 Tax=Piscirickettsia salmonis TaxID=1238 RepID=A0A9Q6LPM0_PISSA|nr:DSD1 family PLP-dependent enzyme [Piscirickettsia salmonis]ALA23935.1 metal-activated pyridoxal enzyme [Piscirickettsia salmonis]APS44350.1 metal-activated pyridoxal enzyme [Piscirickettsia salmonis]APS47711.1 metal-activated pyridoxal enzyme [Piscirickettsia salmonis]APS50859.1 metal-activated pyridoxal enzyme [Piscirickettsia salmonis]APS54062.1 metal-activated pyridoxal enzyme [Piscirickettsia salmonis]
MTTIGQTKQHIDTPALVIDQQKLLANLHFMQKFANQHGKQLRPHAKTHKCSHLAKLQQQIGAIGICVTKIAEAEVLVKHGITGILITSPVVTPQKIQRLMILAKQDSSIMVVIDHAGNAEVLNQAAVQADITLKVLVDIDPGVQRTGTSYQQALILGQQLHELPGLELQGIQCYAGNLQHVHDFHVRQQASSQAMQRASEVFSQFKAANLPCTILTGTGTGTYDIDSQVSLVSEMQPGSYTVMDQEYANIQGQNLHRFDQFAPAMTLLTTVISANHDHHVTVDAGLKSLYIDQTPPRIISHPHLHYDWGGFGDEHGKVTSDGNGPLPKVGDVLELIVPHCDPTINLFDQFYITQANLITEIWPIDLRGKSQ